MKSFRQMTHRVLLLLSIIITACGLCIMAFSVCSSAWQIVYLRELHVYHQHGVWWDCIQRDGKIYSASRILTRRSDSTFDLKCSHKFDTAAQAALESAIAEGDASAKELQLHRVLPQHKAVMILTALAVFFGIFGIAVGIMSVCFKLCVLAYGTLLFLAASCSGLADLIFLLASARINIRYVPGIIEIYEQRLGLAVILHLISSLTLFLALFTSIGSGCILISPRSMHKRRYSSGEYCHYQSPQLRSFQKSRLDTVLEAKNELMSDDLSDVKRDSISTSLLL